ncbi:RDD family protein [soil metagenome]
MAEPASVSYDLAGSRLITGEAVALDLRPTSFVLRAAGAMIDFVAYFLVLYVGLTVLLYTLSGLFLFDNAVSAAVSVSLLVVSLIVVPTAVETITHGRSLGKLAVGARIVRDDGGAIGFRHAFIRNLTSLLEIYSTLGGFAALTGLLNERSKRLGDFLAGTYSQSERVAATVLPVFGVPSALVHWARTADVAPMPDPLSRRIAQFLRQAPRLVASSRTRLAAELAAEATAFVSPVPSVDPELFLAAVSAIRRDRELEALRRSTARLEPLAPALHGLPHGFPPRG